MKHPIRTAVAGCLFLMYPAIAVAQSIVTVAGGGSSSQEGLAAKNVILNEVRGLATDRAGNVYIADTDANVVYRVSVADGTISIYAGNGGGSFSGDNGQARQASLKSPRGIVFDDAGNLFIADYGNSRIRRVDGTTHTITTFAGSDYDPNRINDGDGGQAASAFIPGPSGIAWSNGNLYITDVYYDRNNVRKIDRQGIITTVAGKVGQDGYSGDNGLAIQAQFSGPLAVAVDATGNVYIADSNNSVIRRVDVATQIVTTVVGGGSPADGIGDGGPGTAAQLAYVTSLVMDASGGLLIADAYNHSGLLRRYDPVAKTIARVAGTGQYGGGDDGPAIEAGLHGMFALAIDANQNIYIHDGANNSIRRIDGSSKKITLFAGAGTFIGDGFIATAAILQTPLGLAVDPAGNLLIADASHGLIRKVDARSGIITTLAGALNETSTPEAIRFPLVDLAFGPDGLLYFTSENTVQRINADRTRTVIAGGGNPADGVGDGGLATDANIEPNGISFDTAGNLYIADYGYAAHNRIRKVDRSTGKISTIAGNDTTGFSGDNGPATSAQLDTPRQAVVDRAGNVFIADQGNGAIRRIDAQTKVITTYAGRGNPADGIGDDGPATDASITPLHMAIDRTTDDLYFADQNGHRLRKIDAKTHVITTVAGSGVAYYDGAFSGDNGPAKRAKLNFEYEMSGVALDPAGRIYVADSKNNRVRMVNVCAPVSAATLASPADGSTTSTGPTLRWSDTSGASRFDVYLDTNNPPVALAATDVNVTSYTAANLQAGVRYYWSIVSKGDSFCSSVSTATSRVASFVTSGTCAPGAFDGIAPAAGATTNTASVTLTWQASSGAQSYDVYFGATIPPPLVASGVTGTSYAATVSSGTYSWFIVAHALCDANRTLATATRSFNSSIPSNCVPGDLKVTLTTPADKAANQSTTIDLNWFANNTVSSYDVYFGTTSNPPLLVAGINAIKQTMDGLATSTTYYWRVVARGPCDANGVSSEVRSFTTHACDVPGGVTITFTPTTVTAGTTYALIWSVASGLDADGGYLVERSTTSNFATVESQVTSSTAASFLASAAGTYYHRVRAVSSCNPTAPGPASATVTVSVSPAKPNVVFSLLPSAVVASLGERIENRIGTFALENLGSDPIQVIVGRQEIASPPFFSIVDPTATDAAFITLDPHTPKLLQIRYAGPPNDRSGSYQGVIFVAATGAGLAVTPYAFVNLKIGGGPAVAPQFIVDGIASDYAAFPGFSGDDTNRSPRTIAVKNPGSTPMDLAAEIGPEVWLVPEANWNATPLAPGESRSVKLFTRRSRSPNGSPLPRYTYFTVRTRDGASSRLLVQDNDDLPVSAGRTSRLDVSARSFIVPDVTIGSVVRLTNIGGESVQSELIFTPADSDGFDGTKVKRTTLVLPPNDVLTLTDPLQQLFHVTPPARGSLELRIPRERLGLVTLSSVPVVNRGDGAAIGSPQVIAGITTTGPTSLTLTETSGVEAGSVRLAFFDGAGVKKSESTVNIDRYGTKHFDDIGQQLAGGHIEINVDSGAATVTGIAVDGGAKLVSTQSNGGSATASVVARAYAADTLPSVTTVVPVLAPPASAGATPKFSTSIGFLANSSLAGSFNVTLRTAAGESPVTKTVDVSPGAVKVYKDIGAELFGVASASGSVSVQTVSAGKVYAVLQSASSTTPKPFATLPVQSILSEGLTSASGGAQRALFYDGLEQSIDASRGTRWMLVLNEVAGSSGVVNVRLYEAGNRSSAIAEKNVAIAAYQQRQLDTIFSELGLDETDRRKDRTNVLVVVTAVAGNARVSAMAVSIDNQTGDTKTFTLTPAVGSATPSVTLVKANLPPSGPPGRHRAVRH